MKVPRHWTPSAAATLALVVLVNMGAEMTLLAMVEELASFGSCTDMLRGYNRRGPRSDSHDSGRFFRFGSSLVKLSPVSSVAAVGD